LGLLGVLGNARLVQMVDQLRDQTRLSGLTRLADTPAIVESASEHRVILDAVLRGDEEATMASVRHHLRHVRGIWAGHAEATSPSATRQSGNGDGDEGLGGAALTPNPPPPA
jgi:DNA-binding GntR family transcriptional regulator